MIRILSIFLLFISIVIADQDLYDSNESQPLESGLIDRKNDYEYKDANKIKNSYDGMKKNNNLQLSSYLEKQKFPHSPSDVRNKFFGLTNKGQQKTAQRRLEKLIPASNAEEVHRESKAISDTSFQNLYPSIALSPSYESHIPTLSSIGEVITEETDFALLDENSKRLLTTSPVPTSSPTSFPTTPRPTISQNPTWSPITQPVQTLVNILTLPLVFFVLFIFPFYQLFQLVFVYCVIIIYSLLTLITFG